MNVRLLHRTADQTWDNRAEPLLEDRFTDLRLGPVLEAMAGEDDGIREVCRTVLDHPLSDPEEIRYRQEILRDCLEHRDGIRTIYRICGEAEERRRKCWYRLTSPHLSTVYSSAADLLKIYLESLVQVRKAVEREHFTSEGLRRFAQMLETELSEAYLDEVRSLEYGIGETNGILISARFGAFLQGVSYVTRRRSAGVSRLHWFLQPSYTIAEQDLNGAKDLEIRRDRAINDVANAMAQAAESLEAFTDQLRRELSFYAGALNLWEALQNRQVPACFPQPVENGRRQWENLRDLSLVLEGGDVVGNTLESVGKPLYLVTGANQGGKTTFLRSVGQCQVMGQCGLFVCAASCVLPVRSRIFTHFKRGEDRRMDSGKLDEELERMSRIVARLQTGALLLSNESFSSTNDREGSELFGQITRALLERGIEVFAVTHLMGYALTASGRQEAFCLRAERKSSGERTFRLVPGLPLRTAYGEDLYRRIFPENEV